MYDLKQHIHNFACWTASRASQRGFRKTKEIIQAIHYSNLFEILFQTESRPQTKEQFDQWHEKTADLIIKSLQASQESDYGRAAKIIAVYLKTSILIPEGETSFTSIMHPPIDRILLKNISRDLKMKANPLYQYFVKINWTKINKKQYMDLINHLRSEIVKSEPFWKIEKGWILNDGE